MNEKTIMCDKCGRTLLIIKGSLAEELHNIINNDKRFIDNTELLCLNCIDRLIGTD
jgi:hypothetical protein